MRFSDSDIEQTASSTPGGRYWMTLCALLFFAATLVAQTATHPNRIAQPAITGELTTLPGTVHPATRTATDLGEVDSSMQLGAMTLNISLSADQQKDLDALVAAQQDRSSPLYHQWLTQEEYGARFGLTDSDLQAVTSWLTAQGFTVTGVSKSRTAIHFSGAVWQVESAFHTQMHRFERNGEMHIANKTALQVPAALASVALNVRGLTSFRPKPRIHKSLQPAFTVENSSGTYYNFLAPTDWATIYGVNAIYNAGYTGTGMHVGVVGQTYIQTSDIAKFRTAAGLSSANLNLVCIDATTANCTASGAISTNGDQSEADMDIEWAGGIAKNATVDFVYAPYQDVDKTGVTDSLTGRYYDVFDALQHAIEDYTVSGSVLPVVSMSYGDCESSFSGKSNYVTWVAQMGEEAATQGQTLLVSSGDWGPFTCDYTSTASGQSPAVGGVYVDIPAGSPYYTAVGGTTLSGDESVPTTYWSEANDVVNTALQYIPETAWNDTAALVASSHDYVAATGGGVSQYYSQPSWQSGLVSGQSSYRMVPDVAFSASPEHDGYLICSADDTTTKYGSDCASGFLSSLGYFGANVYGGTSASAPSFAGMLTLLVQKFGKQGNINSLLYGLATQANYGGVVFNATTGGNNVTPCTYNTSTDPGCPSSGSFGYTVSTSFPYYNMATGLGSINGGGLYNALAVNLSSTTTTVSASPSSINLGTAITLTASVKSATAGTITGTVTFVVNGVTLGSATVSGGTATLSNVSTASSITGTASQSGFLYGPNTVTATYSGDANFNTSSGTTTVTVNEPTYTISASSTSLSLSEGSSGTITLSLTSSNYQGYVAFATAVSPASGNVTASVPTAWLSNNATATATLTITASTSAAAHPPATPWKNGGAILLCAVLLGTPLAARRRRMLAVLLTAVAISLVGFAMACGGSGGSSSSSSSKSSSTVNTYKVTVTPTAQGGGAISPSALTITVTVP